MHLQLNQSNTFVRDILQSLKYLESGPPAEWFDECSVECAVVDQGIGCQIEVGNQGCDQVQLGWNFKTLVLLSGIIQ